MWGLNPGRVAESTLPTARLLFSSGSFPILHPGMEGGAPCGRALLKAWLPGQVFAALKLGEDLCSQSLQKILGYCLDDLDCQGHYGKYRMKEGGGTRHSETWFEFWIRG